MKTSSPQRWVQSLLGRLALVVVGIAALAGGQLSGETITNATSTRPTLLVVVGAPGEDAYKERFIQWGERWMAAGQKAGMRCTAIGLERSNVPPSLPRLQEALQSEPKQGWAELWIVLIGHGTFDGKDAKFNLTGSDLSAADLAEALKPFQRRLAIMNCSSASAPFLKALSGTNRTVIVATKAGSEQNFSRFGDYLSSAISDPEADLDKDGQTSLLEAYLSASRKTAEFYQLEGRLSTEHALLDDNGDGFGTPADWFQGIRATKRAKDGAEADGLRAQQLCLLPSPQEQTLSAEVRQRRDAIELQIAALRDQKASMEEAAYYQQLEPLLLELSKLYHGQSTSPIRTTSP